MHRATFFTAWQGVFDATRPRDLSGAGVVALLCLLLVVTGAAVGAWPKAAIWDQARLLEARFELPDPPSPPFGFSVQLGVIALKALLPADAPLDSAVHLPPACCRNIGDVPVARIRRERTARIDWSRRGADVAGVRVLGLSGGR